MGVDRGEHLYGETRYAARKWTRKRRVIIKAEVVRHLGRDPKNNPRFVVTNLRRSARRIILHLPATFPWLSTWRQIARAVGATS